MLTISCLTSIEYFLCYRYLVFSDKVDTLGCFGTLIIIQSLSAVSVGVAQSPRETFQLFCIHLFSDLLRYNLLEAFSFPSIISFTAFVLISWLTQSVFRIESLMSLWSQYTLFRQWSTKQTILSPFGESKDFTQFTSSDYFFHMSHRYLIPMKMLIWSWSAASFLVEKMHMVLFGINLTGVDESLIKVLLLLLFVIFI